jgi:hypothetical protein
LRLLIARIRARRALVDILTIPPHILISHGTIAGVGAVGIATDSICVALKSALRTLVRIRTSKAVAAKPFVTKTFVFAEGILAGGVVVTLVDSQLTFVDVLT